MQCSVLLVDDDEGIRRSIESYLGRRGYKVDTAATADEGLEKLGRLVPDVLLVDLKMPGKDGFYLIEEAQKDPSPTAIIVLSGYGDIQKAVRATKMGASQFIEKPFSFSDMEDAIRRAIGVNGCCYHLMRAEKGGVRIEVGGWTLIGVSDAMKDVYRKVMMVSRNRDATVLIQGESGTGKELVARAIFQSSEHPGGKFVDVNCAALNESLLEAELFGHEKGSFTGAIQTRKGLFEAADGGAIFLDEVGEMPLRLQSELLRVLEEKSFKRVGGVDNIKVNLRVIASTNRNLWEMVGKGEFRRDLFYRLDVFSIEIPPLRERPDDIPVLSSFFLKRYSRACKKHFTGFSAAAMEQLMSYQWPGNVRELRNVIERAVILGSGGTVNTRHLMINNDREIPAYEAEGASSGAGTLEEAEKELIKRVLDQNRWHKARAAEILGISRTTLWQKIKRYGLEPRAL